MIFILHWAKFRNFFFISLTPRFFVNFQSRQKAPSFETLPSKKTIKLRLGRAWFLMSYQDLWSTNLQPKKPYACVVFGCNNTPNQKEDIGLHPVPFYGAENPQNRKQRKNYVDFVQLKQAHWKPTKYSAVCLKRFWDDNFTVEDCEKMKLEFASFQLSILRLYSL